MNICHWVREHYLITVKLVAPVNLIGNNIRRTSLRIFMRDGLSCYVFDFISRKNTFSKEVFDCLTPLLWLGPKA